MSEQWEVIDEEEGLDKTIMSDYGVVAHVFPVMNDDWNIDKKTAEANAKLIVAAPDMKEAIEEILEIMNSADVINREWMKERLKEALPGGDSDE